MKVKKEKKKKIIWDPDFFWKCFQRQNSCTENVTSGKWNIVIDKKDEGLLRLGFYTVCSMVKPLSLSNTNSMFLTLTTVSAD